MSGFGSRPVREERVSLATGPILPDASPPAVLTPEDEDAAWRAIDELTDPRFQVYTRAAARLIEFGESALPYLVAAGRTQRIDFGVPSSATSPVIHRILEQVASQRLVAYLRSPYEDLRNSAVRHLGERKEVGAVPHILAALPDADPSLRSKFFAALQAITAIPEVRPESLDEALPALIDRWREWWETRQPGTGPVEATAAGTSF